MFVDLLTYYYLEIELEPRQIMSLGEFLRGIVERYDQPTFRAHILRIAVAERPIRGDRLPLTALTCLPCVAGYAFFLN